MTEHCEHFKHCYIHEGHLCSCGAERVFTYSGVKELRAEGCKCEYNHWSGHGDVWYKRTPSTTCPVGRHE